MSSNTQNQELHRGLEERHITLMSLGAAIGVGLFLGSATSIKLAGPGIIIEYAVAGTVMFFIMRALGEMAIQKPVSGSFSQYAHDYLGPLLGFLTGWTYWFLWIVTSMAELTAVGIYMQFWLPTTPQWIWSLAALVIMATVNLLTVKAYGEFEFWFALIKVVTIIAMIIIGALIIILGLGNGGVPTGLHNLWNHGGLFPNGMKGAVMALPMVFFAYLGIEMIGVTAGEVKNPEKNLTKAIDNVLWRILIFYVGALSVIMAIYPWNEIGLNGSPFVLTFKKIGIGPAAGIINFVVLTAALSSCNSGIFSTSRMLFNLAENKEAPGKLETVTRGGVPGLAVILSAVFLLIGVLLNYIVPAKVFIWVTSIATFAAIWIWVIILFSQISYRKSLNPREVKALKFKVPFYPVSSWFSLSFLAFVVVVMSFIPDSRIAVIVGPVWILFLVGIYYLGGFEKRNLADQEAEKAEAR